MVPTPFESIHDHLVYFPMVEPADDYRNGRGVPNVYAYLKMTQGAKVALNQHRLAHRMQAFKKISVFISKLFRNFSKDTKMSLATTATGTSYNINRRSLAIESSCRFDYM